MSTTDNGGAIAIKGFNYQKACIILVMIKNYSRDEFHIIPEAEDDFQVHIDDKNIFIQVKGSKCMTLNKLIKKEIIGKNLIPGQDEDIRKIFFWDISASFKKELTVLPTGNITSPLLKYTDEHKDKITTELQLDESQKERLDNQFLYTTPFNNDLTEAISRLFGEMVTQGLHVDKESGRAVLAELSLMIDQKSEVLVSGDDYTEKTINGEYLKNIFIRVQQLDLFDEILDKSKYNTFKKERIRFERTKILIHYQNTKKKAKEHCNCCNLDFENSSEDELIDELVTIVRETDDTISDVNLLVAISVECLCDLWEGES
ncbi:DUF4297 domain-containing protein [Blautia liquoris]|uniref:DUF4297 domain-containing protein n=1 Tax=Blautia liquoris TaxID=2779518 RepID=A0A7M2RIP8_9FIRM|nr:dsDNA nuclease domain-containing protein [Blautia liquoris]QOV19232.1 DUF4297 domain-containing protein [Blautia liquoris]